METGQAKPDNIDEYIADFPPEKRAVLEQIRQTIRAAAPDAEEAISYRMPTIKQNGILVHFAAVRRADRPAAVPPPTNRSPFPRPCRVVRPPLTARRASSNPTYWRFSGKLSL